MSQIEFQRRIFNCCIWNKCSIWIISALNKSKWNQCKQISGKYKMKNKWIYSYALKESTHLKSWKSQQHNLFAFFFMAAMLKVFTSATTCCEFIINDTDLVSIKFWTKLRFKQIHFPDSLKTRISTLILSQKEIK